MVAVASFHLIRERMPRAVLALPRLALDRPALSHTPGLIFWRLLGTGNGSATGPGADLARTALFAVWDDETSLDGFLATSRITRRWSRAGECWSVRLRAVGGHGRWHGFDPLGAIGSGRASGPLAVLTRANVRPAAWRGFRRASRDVDAELRTTAGLLDVVGIGEAPLGRLGTFSLWESAESALAYSREAPHHRRVKIRTREEDWYAEELFARFEPYGSSGSWDGRDPLRPSM